MRFVLVVSMLLAGSSHAGAGAIRHDVVDDRYRDLAERPEYRSAALLVDGDEPEASGVLVDPAWVLTAGHIVDALSSEQALSVRIDGREVGVDEIVRHPEYREKGLGHGVDLALLRLSRRVTHVSPAELYAGDAEQGSIGTTVGFGVSGTSTSVITDPEPTGTPRAGTNVIDQIGDRLDDREFPSNLMIADFDSPNDPSANRIGDATPLPLEYLPVGGDSGGGLFIREAGKTYLAGTFSAMTPRIPDDVDDGIYGSLCYWTRLSLYRDWIRDVTKGISGAPQSSSGSRMSSRGGRGEGRAGAPGIRVSYFPDGPVYARSIGSGGVDLVLHLAAVVNDSDEPVVVEEIVVEARREDGEPTGTRRLSSSVVENRARGVAEETAGPAYDFFRRYYGLDAMLGPDGRPSAGATVEPGEGAVVSRLYLAADRDSDHLRVTARARAPGGEIRTASTTVPIRGPEVRRAYGFPLTGAWYVSNASDPTGSHRWRIAEEFALDLSRKDAAGRSCRDPCDRHEDFYAYGASVHAITDGKVLRVQTGIPTAPLRQPGEPPARARERLQAYAAELRRGNPDHVSGNFVLLEHADGTYSYYGHLQTGSVRVAAGDRVSRGQVIARLGHTGYSTGPHLHFQVTDGPHRLFSRGLPVAFDNVRSPDGRSIDAPLRDRTVVHAAAEPSVAAEGEVSGSFRVAGPMRMSRAGAGIGSPSGGDPAQ